MNREIGIDMYTLICIKWITNKNLLYKKIKFKKKKKTQGKIQRTFCQGGDEEVETKLTTEETRIREGQKSAMARLTQRTGPRAKAEQDQEALAWNPVRLKTKMAKSHISCLEVLSSHKSVNTIPSLWQF